MLLEQLIEIQKLTGSEASIEADKLLTLLVKEEIIAFKKREGIQ